MQRSLVLLKPDCVERKLMGQVISRFESKGLRIVAAKMLRVTPDLAKAGSDHGDPQSARRHQRPEGGSGDDSG